MLCERLCNCCATKPRKPQPSSVINLQRGLEWSRPSRAQQERFQSILRKNGVIATLRREKGHDIGAACGQLRLQTKAMELMGSATWKVK